VELVLVGRRWGEGGGLQTLVEMLKGGRAADVAVVVAARRSNGSDSAIGKGGW